MKKNIIAAIVGAIILFVYQALSWMALHIHDNSMKYTPAQDQIMEVLNANLHEDGMYSMPSYDPSADLSMEQMQEQSKQYVGKPWAMVFYNTSFMDMGAGQFIIGFLINLISVILAIMLVRRANGESRSFGWVFGLIMILPLVCIFQPILQNVNWWEYPWHYVSGEIIDTILGWALTAAFLAWYLRRGHTSASA